MTESNGSGLENGKEARISWLRKEFDRLDAMGSEDTSAITRELGILVNGHVSQDGASGLNGNGNSEARTSTMGPRITGWNRKKSDQSLLANLRRKRA